MSCRCVEVWNDPVFIGTATILNCTRFAAFTRHSKGCVCVVDFYLCYLLSFLVGNDRSIKRNTGNYIRCMTKDNQLKEHWTSLFCWIIQLVFSKVWVILSLFIVNMLTRYKCKLLILSTVNYLLVHNLLCFLIHWLLISCVCSAVWVWKQHLYLPAGRFRDQRSSSHRSCTGDHWQGPKAGAWTGAPS